MEICYSRASSRVATHVCVINDMLQLRCCLLKQVVHTASLHCRLLGETPLLRCDVALGADG